MTTPDPQATPFQPQDAAQVPAPGAPAFPQASTPGYGQPAYGQPGYGQPGYGQPGYAAGQPAYGQPVVGTAPKQWLVAALLAFFLGCLRYSQLLLGLHG